MTAAVIVSIRVGATPLQAFEAFTAEIGEWWRPNPLFALTPRGDGHLRFEPGEGGRLVTTLANGKSLRLAASPSGSLEKGSRSLGVRRHSPPDNRPSLTCTLKR